MGLALGLALGLAAFAAFPNVPSRGELCVHRPNRKDSLMDFSDSDYLGSPKNPRTIRRYPRHIHWPQDGTDQQKQPISHKKAASIVNRSHKKRPMSLPVAANTKAIIGHPRPVAVWSPAKAPLAAAIRHRTAGCKSGPAPSRPAKTAGKMAGVHKHASFAGVAIKLALLPKGDLEKQQQPRHMRFTHPGGC